MSASREKKFRQDQTSTSWSDPKTAREAEARKAQKRSNAMYTAIAVVFVLVAVIAVIWRANLIPKMATAVTIDGEDYKVNEVTFYYQNTRSTFLTPDNYQILGMLGVDMRTPLDNQVINENVATYLETEAGKTWKEFFMDETLEQMASIQYVLKAAEEEGFVYPDSVQAEYDKAMESLKTAAANSNVSVNTYLQSQLGRTMTEQVYGEHLMRMMKYSAYMTAHRDSLTYTDAELENAYKAEPNSYDKVHYEVINISNTPAPTTDEEGNPKEATEEEIAAAKDAAKQAADEMLAAWKNGGNLETLAEGNENASYSNIEKAAYAEGNPVSDWLFDAARKTGDAAVLENGSSSSLVVFHDRFRENENTVDVRHILIRPEAGKLQSSDAGYADEQTKLKADAKAKAEEILEQWKSGEATAESFGKLAMENSADSNAADGGIYTQVYQGMMLPSFNDWCFDSARKAGDTGIVETDYGYHVMYFVGTNIPKWKVDVTRTLQDADFKAWSDPFGADYKTEIHSLGAKFIA